MARPTTLPASAESLVVSALKQHQQPMSAYHLLQVLTPIGIKSAPIIYRALEALMHKNRVHKVHQLNAYVACNCTDDHQHEVSALTVCTGCKHVTELHDHAILHHLGALRGMQLAIPHDAVIEIPIRCNQCEGQHASHPTA